MGGFKTLTQSILYSVMRRTFIEQWNCVWHFPRRHFLRLKVSSWSFITSEKSSLVTLTKGVSRMLAGSQSLGFTFFMALTTEMVHLFVSCLLSVSTMEIWAPRLGTAPALFAADYPEQGQTWHGCSVNKGWISDWTYLAIFMRIGLKEKEKSKESKQLQRRKNPKHSSKTPPHLLTMHF